MKDWEPLVSRYPQSGLKELLAARGSAWVEAYLQRRGLAPDGLFAPWVAMPEKCSTGVRLNPRLGDETLYTLPRFARCDEFTNLTFTSDGGCHVEQFPARWENQPGGRKTPLVPDSQLLLDYRGRWTFLPEELKRTMAQDMALHYTPSEAERRHGEAARVEALRFGLKSGYQHLKRRLQGGGLGTSNLPYTKSV